MLQPQFIEKNGVPEFVVLPIDEFNRVNEIVENYEDLIELRERKSEGNKKISHKELMQNLDLFTNQTE